MQKTVLILGAGSSMPYKFPSGIDLMKGVVKRAKEIALSGDSLAKACNDLATSMESSGCDSIDAFLAYRQEFREMGKLLIAMELLHHEKSENAHSFHGARDEDWIRIIFNAIPTDQLKNLKIVTFNYDRVFEFKLIEMLVARGLKAAEIKKIYTELSIVHVYGRLFPMPLEDGILAYGRYAFNNEFGKFSETEDLSSFSQIYRFRSDLISGFKLLGDGSENIKQALEHILWSERIIFLGWAFHRENMKLLGLPIGVSMPREKRVYATLKNTPKIAKKRLFEDFTFLNETAALDMSCGELFLHHLDIME